MNKTAIKNYAIWARNKLISDIEYKAGLMGITEKGIAPALPQSTNEVQFFDIGTKDYATLRGEDIHQRDSFIAAIRAKEQDVDYEQAFRFIVEKVAYIWFNRLVAIRFMEINDYLPSRVRILSSENPSKAEPDMVTRPFDTDMTFTHNEEDLIMRLKDENKLDELFRWLFIKQCKKLHDVLPVLFSDEQGEDYLELLLTISFTDKDGVLWHLVHDIPEDDFNVEKEGQVEIIGWMYQYYNTEPKEQVFADLKKNIKISKDKIPAATQLFTPDWIVRYMVENSLGRIYVNAELAKQNGELSEEARIEKENAIAERMGWKYYLPEAAQEPEVRQQLNIINSEYAALSCTDLKCIDPCMGSGHILVYLFDVLMQIYESQGWTQREAAQSIVHNNLYGLDIDERAAQLAYFAVMMKARQYDRRFLDRGIEPHVYDIRESNGISSELLDYFAGEGSTEAYYSGRETPKLYSDIATLMKELRDAKEYGSILNITKVDFPALYARFDEIKDDISMYVQPALTELLPLVQRAEVMSQKYDVVVTNPPYMGASGMGAKLTDFVKKYYSDSKSDLYAVCIDHGFQMLKPAGFESMITMESWMFLTSFEKMRIKLNNGKTIISFIHMPYLGKGGTSLGINFGTDMAVIRNIKIEDYLGTYDRIAYYETNDIGVPFEFPVCNEYYKHASQNNFSLIPGTPIAYWVSSHAIEQFNGELLGEKALLCQGLSTTDNEKYVRYWYEIHINTLSFNSTSTEEACLSSRKWFPFNKGGVYRKWYGNRELVVNYENDGRAIKQDVLSKYPYLKTPDFVVKNSKTYFQECLTWSALTSGGFSIRFSPAGAICADKGQGLFANNHELLCVYCAFLNSIVADYFLQIISPTLDFNCGYLRKIPFQISQNMTVVYRLSEDNINISTIDWDSYEISWDFKRHPLI